MSEIIVTEDYAEPGFCRQYYKVVSIKGKSPNNPKMLICVQEEMPEQFEWYTTTSDGTWNEPEGTIRKEFTIKDTEGNTLREGVKDEGG